jgi:hypothetical protein
VEAEIQAITRKPWVRRVVTWQLAGDQPKDLRLTWGIDEDARAALEEELFGKHVLITSHDGWPPRSSPPAGPSPKPSSPSASSKTPRRLLLPGVPLDRAQHPRPRLHHCARPAARPPHAPQGRPAGLHLLVRELLSQLAGIGETVLIYPSTGGRPKARRMTTELTGDQQKLYEIFGLDRWPPRS